MSSLLLVLAASAVLPAVVRASSTSRIRIPHDGVITLDLTHRDDGHAAVDAGAAPPIKVSLLCHPFDGVQAAATCTTHCGKIAIDTSTSCVPLAEVSLPLHPFDGVQAAATCTTHYDYRGLTAIDTSTSCVPLAEASLPLHPFDGIQAAATCTHCGKIAIDTGVHYARPAELFHPLDGVQAATLHCDGMTVVDVGCAANSKEIAMI